MSPLAGHVLDPGEPSSFVLAEWSDDGSRPGEPIVPLHVHLTEDEAWYVLEGTLRIRLGDAEVDAPAGTAVFGRRGIAHSFANPDPLPARYVLIMQPQTWSLIRALHGSSADEVDPTDVYRAHGAQLIGTDT
jgi:mannose-6-phosphate isomerase-like protein (cupin superfamily)